MWGSQLEGVCCIDPCAVGARELDIVELLHNTRTIIDVNVADASTGALKQQEGAHQLRLDTIYQHWRRDRNVKPASFA